MLLFTPDVDRQCAGGHNDLFKYFDPGTSQMAKSAPVNATGPRRGIAQRPGKQTGKKKIKYAPEPTAEEYKSFPPGFRLENGSYPVEEILEAEGVPGPKERRKYLVRWKPHPYTLQEFEPTWVGHRDVTHDLLASWEEKKRSQEETAIIIIPDNGNDVNSESPVAGPSGDYAQDRKLRHSNSASKDREYTVNGTTRQLKRQKSQRIVLDGSSEVEHEEEAKDQNSSTHRSQTTASTASSSLRSPPPEIADSQELIPLIRPISIVVPPRPAQAEEFIPVSSNRDFGSSSHVSTTLGFHPSAEATPTDYPTPDPDLESPALSDTSPPRFFPETELSSTGLSASLQRNRQEVVPVDFDPRKIIERSTTQTSLNESQNGVQVCASGILGVGLEKSQQTPLPSARLNVEPPASTIEETPTVEGTRSANLDPSTDWQTPLAHQLDGRRLQTQQSYSSNAAPSIEKPLRTSVSPSRSQISSLQSQRQSFFRTLHAGGIESWLSSQRKSSRPHLQSPLTFSQSVGENLSEAAPVKGDSSRIGSLESKPFTSPFRIMSVPPHRSSPRTAHASTPSRTSRGTTMTLQEQLAQSRALRQSQRNATSASPMDTPIRAPVVPQIREPTPVQLTTRTSNPALPRVESSEIALSSAMQMDESSSSKAQSQVTHSASGETTSTPNVYIQQSIEMDEPDRPFLDTQDSSAPESSDAQENGHTIHSPGQGLMPTFPILQPGEFAIPLHAEGKTQHAYQEALQAKQKALSKYLRRGSSSSTPSSNGLVTPKTEANEMAALVGCLDNIVSLIDLGYDGMMTQSSYSGSQLAKWTVKISSKFAFVKVLIEALQVYDSSLIIFARAGQTQQVFENFLSDNKVDFRTYAASGGSVPDTAAQGKCTVHLVAAGQKPDIELKSGPSLIIAFDTSYDPRSDYVLDLRGEEGRQIPVIYLLVSNSSEHIERCLPVNMPSPQRNRLLMQTILRGSSHMGKILSEENNVTREYYSHLSGGTRMYDDDLQRKEQTFMKMPDFHLKKLAQQVAKALVGKEFSTTWSTSPPMPPLKLDDIPGLMTQQLRLPSPSPIPASPIGTPSLRKRLLDGDDTPGGSKRQRMTPVPGTSPHEHNEAAYILHLQHALKAAKDEAANEKLVRMGAEESRNKSRTQLNEWRQSVSELQKRVEYHRDRDHKGRTKIKQLTKEAERFTQLRERDATERDALKTQVLQLQGDLARARQDLKEAGGDIAALELAREEARVASAALTKTQKELAVAKQQGEYFALQYRETMTTGRQHQADAEELQAKIKGLEIDASDEKRRLKLVNFDEAAKVHMERIEKLEYEKKTLEAMVRKLNAENTLLKANRGVSTRASSVQPPGSPRAREAKSRGVSPVPGLMAAVSATHSGSRASALRHER